MPIDAKLAQLRSKIQAYGKESLGELLYALAEGAQVVSGNQRIRIYLEDLTTGALSCVHATRENVTLRISFDNSPVACTQENCQMISVA